MVRARPYTSEGGAEEHTAGQENFRLPACIVTVCALSSGGGDGRRAAVRHTPSFLPSEHQHRHDTHDVQGLAAARDLHHAATELVAGGLCGGIHVQRLSDVRHGICTG